MTYSISCVLLIPDAHRDDTNALAEEQGYGPDNLSVPLVKSDGTKWWGCHTWCTQKFLDRLAEPDLQTEFASALVVSAIDGGDPGSNWAQALADNGLTIPLSD